jgi:uncharacterized protein (TIGR03437 family)
MVTAGLTSATFIATAGSIVFNQNARLTATYNNSSAYATIGLTGVLRLTTDAQGKVGTSSQSAIEAVPSVHLDSIACTPQAVTAGTAGTCAIALDNVAETDVVRVQLSRSSGSIKVPATVTTRAGQANLEFQFDSVKAIGSDEDVVVKAQLGTDTVQATVKNQSRRHLAMQVPAHPTVKFGNELRFSVSAEDPAASISAASLPAGATFNPADGAFDWTPLAAQQGAHRVVFRAINAAGEAGSAPVTIDVDNGEPVVTSVVNAASRSVATACSPGSIASLEGTGLSQEPPAADPSGVSLALGGTSVFAYGTAVPILYSSASRVDFLCPSEPPGTPLQIVLQTAGKIASTVQTTEQEIAPGIFSVDESGTGQGLVLHSDNSTLAMIRNYRYAALPVAAGDTLLVYATGITGASRLQVKIGGATATVEAITPVPGKPGLFCIAAVAPEGSGSANAGVVSVIGELLGGGMVSSNQVNITIEGAK